MSLDWNTKECPSNGVTSGWITQDSPAGEQATTIHPDTNSLVWGAMCGFRIGQITPKNIDEVVWRIEYLKRCNLPWLNNGEFPSAEAVDQHLDLYTNADTLTRRKFTDFVTKLLSDKVNFVIDEMYTSQQRVEEAANNVHDGMVEAAAS